MTGKIMITAETGSDITKELAQEFGITLIPMHVSLGNETRDDGTFPPEDVCAYYSKTGKVPTTSGSTPYDFESVYDRLFAEDPDLQILHLAYSAVTTCSYHSCELAIEGKPYAQNVRIVDTKQVSVGQCAVAVATAKWLEAHPEATLDEAVAAAVQIGEQIKMCFIPDNLDYLRAGGRCSNAVALVGNLLQLLRTTLWRWLSSALLVFCGLTSLRSMSLLATARASSMLTHAHRLGTRPHTTLM